ncbi:MAG: DUF4446 family protein [Candidatus Eremiobacteraeota bacterium]|nr:DUF4446 family protein [Candidatus Eremiobacteraeota bacterium]
MQTSLIITALAVFVAALIALVIYHAAVVKPALARLAALVETHDQLIGGGASASQRLDRLDARVAEVGSALGRAEGRVSELEALSRTDVSRVGFVRYDAFDESGAELSYALALLNRDGDGVVISSIYSRADTRTFGKAVQGFKPAANASDEELRAIERARTKNE